MTLIPKTAHPANGFTASPIDASNQARFIALLQPSLIAELAADSGTINSLFQTVAYPAPHCADETDSLAYFKQYPHTFPTFVALCSACALGEADELADSVRAYDALTIKLPGSEISRADIKDHLRALRLKTASAYVDALLDIAPQLKNLAALRSFDEAPLAIFFDALCDELAQHAGALRTILNVITAPTTQPGPSQSVKSHGAKHNKRKISGVNFSYEGKIKDVIVQGDAQFGTAHIHNATIEGFVRVSYAALIGRGTHILKDLSANSASVTQTTIDGDAKISYQFEANELTLGGTLSSNNATITNSDIRGNVASNYKLEATNLTIGGTLSSNNATLDNVTVARDMALSYELKARRLKAKGSLSCNNAQLAQSEISKGVNAAYTLAASDTHFGESVSANNLTLDKVNIAANAKAAYSAAVTSSTIGGLLSFAALDTTITSSTVQALYVGAVNALSVHIAGANGSITIVNNSKISVQMTAHYPSFMDMLSHLMWTMLHYMTLGLVKKPELKIPEAIVSTTSASKPDEKKQQIVRLRSTQVLGDITFEDQENEGIVEADASSTVAGTIIRGRLERI